MYVASVQGDWHTLAADEARFEDGTVSFGQIPDLEAGLSWVNGIGIDLIHQRVMCLAGWLLGGLGALDHGNGEPMARISAASQHPRSRRHYRIQPAGSRRARHR